MNSIERSLPSSDGRTILGLSILFRCFHGNLLFQVSLCSLEESDRWKGNRMNDDLTNRFP